MSVSTARDVYSAGIDFGGTSTKLALVARDGRVCASRRLAGPPGGDLDRVFACVREALGAMAGEAGLPFPPPGGAGVGVAGIVDVASGRVETTGALAMGACDLRGPAERALGCHVAVESDSNAGALADLYFGAAQGADDVIYLSWGTGIGAGLVMGRRLLRSHGKAIGEIGHTRVALEGGRACYCGCRGCLEAEAGGRTIAARGAEALGREATVLDVARAAGADPACLGILEQAAACVARGLSPAIVLLNPQAVVLGGGVSRVLEQPAVRRAFDGELERSVPRFAWQALTVSLSAFGDMAGAVGAALLPRQSEEGRRHGSRGE